MRRRVDSIGSRRRQRLVGRNQFDQLARPFVVALRVEPDEQTFAREQQGAEHCGGRNFAGPDKIMERTNSAGSAVRRIKPNQFDAAGLVGAGMAGDEELVCCAASVGFK